MPASGDAFSACAVANRWPAKCLCFSLFHKPPPLVARAMASGAPRRTLFKEGLIYEQSAARRPHRRPEKLTYGWPRQPLKIEQLGLGTPAQAPDSTPLRKPLCSRDAVCHG